MGTPVDDGKFQWNVYCYCVRVYSNKSLTISGLCETSSNWHSSMSHFLELKPGTVIGCHICNKTICKMSSLIAKFALKNALLQSPICEIMPNGYTC